MNDKITDGLRPTYARRYFQLSKTWDEWNKLSVADVFALKEDRNFQGQSIYFWLNHPIRYVRLVGMVVQVDLVAYDKFVLITLDDGSGANIEVKLERRLVKADDAAEYPSNTLLDNATVIVQLGLPKVYVDHSRLDVGSIIRAQGTITTFRDERQLLLKRVFLVKDTNEEAIWWSKAAHWKRSVLSNPWILTEKEQSEFDEQCRAEEAKARLRLREKRRIQDKRTARLRRREEKMERKRLRDEAELDQGALRGTDKLPLPWDP